MTLLFMDGFDHYATGDVFRKYDHIDYAAISSDHARFSGQGISLIYGPDRIHKIVPTASQTIIFGIAFKIAEAGSLGTDLVSSTFSFGNGSGTHIKVTYNTSNQIMVVRDDDTTLGTTTNSLSTLQWYYFEIKIKVDDSVGTIDIHVNGESWLSLSGIDTANNAALNIDRFSVRCADINMEAIYDDLYFCNDQGTVNNDFLGDIRIATILPNGAGNHTDFTPSTGSNYENVDDATDIDDDSTYNSSNTATDKDSYNLATSPTDMGTVHGIQVNSTVRKTDAGSKVVKPFVRTNSTDYSQGSNINLSDSYTLTNNILETNPADSAAWEKADLDALEVGLEIIS